MTLASGDLTTLPTAQIYLDSPPSATVLSGLITRTSMMIRNYLNRPFILPKTYTEQFDGTGTNRLVLPAWPLLNLTSLRVSGVSLSLAPQLNDITYTNNPFGYRFQVWDGVPPGDPVNLELTGGAYFWRGNQNVVITYNAGYQVTGEQWVVPGSPFHLTPLIPYGSWATDQGVIYANGTALTPVAAAPTVGHYVPPNPNAATPILYYLFSAADAGQTVSINYGFIPADLEQVILEMLQERSLVRKRPGVRGQVLASQESVTYSDVGFADWEKIAMQPYISVLPPARGGLNI